MAYNVLVADDSLTIQKVVSITLSNGDFKLVESLNESDLVAKVSSQTFDLILIDFNLSETKNGYDLCREVHKLAPGTPIMAMLGTFDSVDEASLSGAGVLDKIVKPFESEKFIAKCISLVNASATSPDSPSEDTSWADSQREDSEQEPQIEEDFGDQWVVEGKSQDSEKQEDDLLTSDASDSFTLSEEAPNHETKLHAELEGWGIRVPGVIGDDKGRTGPTAVPPVISSAKVAEQDDELDNVISLQENEQSFTSEEIQEENDDVVVPDQGDLEYPDMGLDSAPKSKLIPIDELSDDDESSEAASFDEDKTDPVVNIGALNELQKEIEEDLSPDDFWAVDDSQGVGEFSLDEVNLDLEVDQFEPEEVQENVTFSAASRDELSDDEVDKIAEKLKEKLSPLIEQMVDDLAKKYCQQSIDKVAWEVIPDLAENLIRKEIQNISESVKNH